MAWEWADTIIVSQLSLFKYFQLLTGYIVQISHDGPLCPDSCICLFISPSATHTFFSHWHLRDPQCAVLYSTYNFIYILHRQFPVYKLLVPTPLFLLLDHITFPSQCIWVISACLTPPTKFADFLYGIPGLTHFLRNPCNILCRTNHDINQCW